MTDARRSEAAYIDLLREALAAPPSPTGPGDDAAVVPTARAGRLVLTTDALVEGVHFFRRHPAEALGWKALAVNVSDVGAMGATPAAFVLSVALPEDLPHAWFEGFAQGLGACARRYGASLAGGDTVRSSGPLMISITAWGWTAADAVMTRDGGRPGDVLAICGHVGRAAAGFSRWRARGDLDEWGVPPEPVTDGLADAAVRAHLRPEPPVEAGARALALGATAGLDLSDGLAVDLPRLAEASGVTLEVDLDALPPDPTGPDDAIARAEGGEDYALAVLVPAEAANALLEMGFFVLGRARERRPDDPRSVIWRLRGAEVTPGAAAFRHFSGG